MSTSRKRRRVQQSRKIPGAAPGTLVVDPNAPVSKVELLAYGPHQQVDLKDVPVSQISEYLTKFPVVWVNVEGLGDLTVLQELGRMFHLHPLALEDVVNLHQRAKVEVYGDQLFIVTQMVTLTEQDGRCQLESEQLSMFLGPGFVLSFQQGQEGDVLNPVRERVRRDSSHIRVCGPDHLAYAMLDAVIDHYFPVVERFGERLEDLEDAILGRPAQSMIAEIHQAKRELLLLRRNLWPQREAVNALIRDPIPLITDETRVYLRDCHDHAMRLMDLVETSREVCSDLMDLYLSSVSNRMNEIMKVLTVMSTLFIPLTFVVGIYGMNFDRASPWNMPELGWRYGYPACILVMVLMSIGQLLFFWRRGWIFGRR